MTFSSLGFISNVLKDIKILKYNSGGVVQSPFFSFVEDDSSYNIKAANSSNTTKVSGDKFYLIPTSIAALVKFLNSDINPIKDRIFAYKLTRNPNLVGIITRFPGIGGRIDINYYSRRKYCI